MRPLFAACLMVLACALLARPAAADCNQSGGLNLRWDHCYGDGGTANKAFACDTNAGSEVLVASFVSHADIPLTNGLSAYVDLATSSGSWPSWWAFESGSGCRSTFQTLSMSTAPDPAETVCEDLWSGASGGVNFSAGQNGPDTRWLRVVLAVPPGSEFTVPAGAEVLGFRIVIKNTKTVGASACGGCSTPMCIALSEIALSTTTDPNGASHILCGPANGTDSHLATWQSAGINATTRPVAGELGFKWWTTDMICTAATRARRTAWGGIKTLYR